MPDPTFETVSASQVAMLWNSSPRGTEWMLWKAFAARSLSILEPEEDERMLIGKLMQPVILELTARKYKLHVEENTQNHYTRCGHLGATVDGHMIAPDIGPVVVEAKNIDYLRWRDTWTEETAAPHVEIQTQINMHAAGAKRGIIAALVGGNDLRLYERELNLAVVEKAEEDARLFLDSVRDRREPAPIGSPLELPLLGLAYPERVPDKVIEAYDNLDVAYAIRQFEQARSAESFEKKRKEQYKTVIQAAAKDAAVLKAYGWTAYLKNILVRELVCEPHAAAKLVKNSFTQVKIKCVQTSVDGPIATGDNQPMGI